MTINENGDSLGRRRFLTIAVSALAGAGVVGVATPLVKYWNPSEKAKTAAAPVTFDFSKLEKGAMVTIEWQGKPVWILRRTQQNLDLLSMESHRQKLRDPDSSVNQQPDYAKNEHRSLNPEYLIVVGICTHLGCVPLYEKEGRVGEENALFFCPCHGSKFDLAGRVYKNVPAPTNLIIPPYQFVGDKRVRVGIDANTLI